MKRKNDPSAVGRKKRFYWKIFIYAAVLCVLVLFARLDFIIVTCEKNGEYFTAMYQIDEENFSHPRLKLLRAREHLDEVVAPGKTQFEKIVLLRHWTRKQWEPGNRFYYPPWDAVEILDLARKYNNHGFCAQYAIVFLQACQSLGLHARYVDLPGHFVVGVWSDEYNKWVMMDPLNDIYFEENSEPMNCRNLSNAYWSNDVDEIYKVAYDGTKTKIKRKDISLYRMFSVILRANHLSEPMVITQNGAVKKLTLQKDYRNYPLIGNGTLYFSADALAWKDKRATEFFNGRLYSDHPDDFRYVQNQTIILIAKKYPAEGVVKVILWHDENNPTFKTYLVNINGRGWQESKEKTIINLKPGYNTLHAKVLTSFGWQGNESYINMFYKPDWFSLFFSNKNTASRSSSGK